MSNNSSGNASWIDNNDLPASFRTRTHSLALPCDQFDSFLDSDLSVARIEDILPHLWLVGRPYLPRALNIQNVLNRAIVPTTEPSLHLVWTSGRIFVKALPAYVLSPHFYDHYLRPSNCHPLALGLLHSYLALIPTELDFELARQANLLPSSLDWTTWRDLTRRVLEDYPDNTIYASLPRRYVYGELRLGRLNKIYRCLYGDWLHGYSNLTSTTRYVDFFSKNLGAFAALTIYMAVVLSAMSVGLATDSLQSEKAFQRACYGFAVFAIISPMAIVASVVAVAMVMFLANWSRTVAVQRERFDELKIQIPKNKRRGKTKNSGSVA